jgi:hypothetical protein
MCLPGSGSEIFGLGRKNLRISTLSGWLVIVSRWDCVAIASATDCNQLCNSWEDDCRVINSGLLNRHDGLAGIARGSFSYIE